MKTTSILLLLLLALFFNQQVLLCQGKTYKIHTIAFYNVENLFDTIDNPISYDDDFSPNGKNQYASKIYWKKIENTSQVILNIGKEKTKNAPAIIGLAEIENHSVLKDLINSKNLSNKNYQIIHFDSPDQRGIDVALLYRESCFTPIDQEVFEVKIWDESGSRIYTRDQLLVKGILDNELIYLIVNHWPSRRGGKVRSDSKRKKAAYVTSQIIEKIKLENDMAKIIIMGDFNDDPIDENIRDGLNSNGNVSQLNDSLFYNPMEKMYKKGYNTLGYRDALNLFDQILISPPLIIVDNDYKDFKFYKAGIFNPPYLITQKGKYKGYPYRSYERGKYTGGYSDHYPVYIYLIKEE